MRKTTSLWPLLVLLATLAVLSGCSDDQQATPVAPEQIANLDQPPTLPDPAKLTVDLDFFAAGEKAEKLFGRANFFNAYLRAVIVSATTELVLAPPVAAFALALHTVPNHQQDGSWIWVYTFVDGEKEAQIRLRGLIEEDIVHWEMRVTAPDAGIPVELALWFEGTTQNEGDQGHWTFFDPAQIDSPAVAALDWNNHLDGHELSLQALAGEAAGDALTFSANADDRRIDYAEGDSDAIWFIRWNEADGTGSLQVPDYNNGLEACWDEQQYDVDCSGS